MGFLEAGPTEGPPQEGGQPDGRLPAQTTGGQRDQGDQEPRARKAPKLEAEWLQGTTHLDMRYGDWRCGVLPCRYPNHAYRTACKVCGESKDNAKWVLPHDPTATLCACGVQILPHY